MAGMPALGGAACPGEEDDSDDEYFRLFIMPTMGGEAKRAHSGSVEGRRSSKDRDRAEWGARLMADYFGESPTYDASTFR
jgi:hypothetical protein